MKKVSEILKTLPIIKYMEKRNIESEDDKLLREWRARKDSVFPDGCDSSSTSVVLLIASVIILGTIFFFT